MEKNNNYGERVRKKRSPNGSRSQKTVTFRLDTIVESWLEIQPNKGRYINSLIWNDMMAHNPENSEPETP